MAQVTLVLVLMLCSIPDVSALPVPATVPDDVEAMFIDQTWNRTDQPVATTDVSRTWMWGEAVTQPMNEAYDGAAASYDSNGQAAMTRHDDERIVQYFDKARMEYDENRQADPPWNVTTGLLAKELITGELQLGDGLLVFTPGGSTIPLAGDPDSGDITPSYTQIAVTTTMDAYSDGQVIGKRLLPIEDPRNPGNFYLVPQFDAGVLSYGVTAVAVDVPTSHTVASVFWEFMNSDGVIFEHGQHVTGPLFQNPFYATGYPLGESVWTRTRVQSVEKDVLVQCFERRCLTYTPDNPVGWKVEFGNVGQHYYQWRYEQLGTEITGDVTGYALNDGYQQPSIITVETPDVTYAVQVQLLQNIVLPMAGSCFADESMTYVASRLDDVPVYFEESLRSNLQGNVINDESDDFITIVANRIWIGTEYLNETLVREGYATVSADPHATSDGWVRYPSPLMRERLLAAQELAQIEGKGFWGACDAPAEIAYLVFDVNGARLYLTDASGGQLRSVFLGSADDPVWSPDGSRIALSGLCVVTVGTMSTNCPVPGGREPSWSPDGSQLVFSESMEAEDGGTQSDLFIIDADGSNRRRLTSSLESDTYPKWSPDGSRIVFFRSSGRDSSELHLGDLFAIRPDGSGEVNLTDDPAAIDHAANWSPDGAWLAFSKFSNPETIPQTSDVYVMRPDGTELRRLSSDESDGQDAIWSPVGTTIAFDGLDGVYLINADGTDELYLTPGVNPSWSPDGSHLVVISKPDEYLDEHFVPNMYAYIVNADGSGRRKLTVDQVFEYSPVWSPVPVSPPEQ